MEHFIKISDVNGDGEIDEEEFVKFVLIQQHQSGIGDWKRVLLL